jgi:hemolysin III
VRVRAISTVPKPRWRGRLHQIAWFASVPAGFWLVADARPGRRFAAAVFALTLFGLYGVSSTYHLRNWSPLANARMRKLDHSMIFVLIAGSYTAIGLIALRGVWSQTLLAVVWAGAIAGIGMKVFGLERTRHVTGTMYIVLGWAAIVAAPKFVAAAGAEVTALIVAGGILYTLGAIVFVRARPDPSPRVFGYHEVWHSFVVAASTCHYFAVMLLAH